MNKMMTLFLKTKFHSVFCFTFSIFVFDIPVLNPKSVRKPTDLGPLNPDPEAATLSRSRSCKPFP